MRNFLLFLAVLTATTTVAQTVEETLAQTFWCPNDSFAIRYKDDANLSYYTASRKDKISPGTDGAPGEYVVFYYGNDSLKLNYHNRLPYAHIIYLNFASPKGKTTLRFHFNAVMAYFPTAYMAENAGNIQFDIPEAYELANIIWLLSPSGQRAKDLLKEGEYYQQVVSYFKPYLNHPIFKALDFPDSTYAANYYNFRENSFAFNFQDPQLNSKNTKLLFNGPYYYVYGEEMADSSLFGKLKPLVEDFAATSKFRQFYNSKIDFYKREIEKQKELLPVKQMWQWLEDQFPARKFQSYRIVFSPLIGGSHSTQNYTTFNKTAFFKEAVMFVCGPTRYQKMPGVSEKQKEGLMSGIVFTEIDHNYINPATNKYAPLVDSIFSNRGTWTKQGASSDFYGSPVSVFNEYMTHAAFCLYMLEMYDKPTADYVIANREALMVERRGFTKFREFHRELIRLREQNRNLKVVELYPLILDWCKRQQ